jgi:Sulfatase
MAVAETSAAAPSWTFRLREPSVRWAQLLAASSFALAQPLFDILGKNAEFFAVRGSAPSDIVVFALVVVFLPSLVLLAVELLVGLASARAAFLLHLVFLGALAAVFGIQFLKRHGLDGTVPLILGAIVIGAALAVAVWRVSLVSSFLTVLAAAAPVFLVVFLFTTPVEKLVFPADVNVETANVRSDTPVVFLLFDEFPVISLLDEKGEIDAKRFPNFARLQKASTWFKNTTTYSASTTVAVPSMLSAKLPERGKLPVFQNHPDNLFTFLGRRYAFNVQESQTRLCPPQLCERNGPDTESRLRSLYTDARVVYLHLVAPPALEERLAPIDESWGNFGGDAEDLSAETVMPKIDKATFYIGRVRDYNRWLASVHKPAPGKPSLDFLHVLLPHGPWLYFPDGKVQAVASPRAPGRVGELWTDDGLALQAWQRHLLQLGFADKLLGRFLDKLERTGLWDKALVVVTADHGISFRGGDKRRAPTDTNLAELAFTPLFMKMPGEDKGKVVSKHVTIDDILPTIADVLGAKVPWKTDGESALAPGPGPDTVTVGRMTKPYDETLAQRQTSLQRQLDLFGSGNWGPGFYGIGPYGGLVGKPVPELDVSVKAPGAATVDAIGSELLQDYRVGAAAVPSPIVGTLSGGPKKGDTIALAVNGTVQAVATAYQDPEGPVRFTALTSEKAFRDGANEIRMFVVGGTPAKPELRELQVSYSG